MAAVRKCEKGTSPSSNNLKKKTRNFVQSSNTAVTRKAEEVPVSYQQLSIQYGSTVLNFPANTSSVMTSTDVENAFRRFRLRLPRHTNTPSRV
jgi:hypothetical protein